MGIFDSLAGSPTLNKQTQSPTQRDYGTFDPSLPFPPLWSEDGKTRYGFRRWFNGYVRGPEGTSLALLQAAVNAGMVPGIHPNSAGQYPMLTLQDYFDAMYIQAGQTSLYDAYVRAAPVVDPGQPNFPPPSPPVNPVDPNPQSPITDPPAPDPSVASLRAEVADLSQKLALAQSSLRKVNSQLDSANALAGKLLQVAKVINGIDIPERGGGWPTNTLRKIAAIIDK